MAAAGVPMGSYFSAGKIRIEIVNFRGAKIPLDISPDETLDGLIELARKTVKSQHPVGLNWNSRNPHSCKKSKPGTQYHIRWENQHPSPEIELSKNTPDNIKSLIGISETGCRVKVPKDHLAKLKVAQVCNLTHRNTIYISAARISDFEKASSDGSGSGSAWGALQHEILEQPLYY